jgi:metal-dependent hydrolase (beta-lactamase superfamily II)
MHFPLESGIDNNTLIDHYFLAEPGLSILVETDQGIRVLFDVGYSDIFLRNAQKMDISLADLDFVAISHGHSDHTWGLEPLARYYAERRIGEIALANTRCGGPPKDLRERQHGTIRRSRVDDVSCSTGQTFSPANQLRTPMAGFSPSVSC